MQEEPLFIGWFAMKQHNQNFVMLDKIWQLYKKIMSHIIATRIKMINNVD